MNNQPIALNDTNFDTTVSGTSQPVLIDFYADWCGPCKAIAPVMSDLAAEFEGRAVITKVDVDTAPQVVEHIVGLTTRRVLSQKLESLIMTPAAAR